MSSTSAAAPIFCLDLSRADQLDALGPAGRLRAYRRGELAPADLYVWASRYPDEPPTVNGKYAWIGFRLADLD